MSGSCSVLSEGCDTWLVAAVTCGCLAFPRAGGPWPEILRGRGLCMLPRSAVVGANEPLGLLVDSDLLWG